MGTLSLEKLGFTADCPVEAILTTFSPKGEPHASTMGVRMTENGEIEAKIFTSTKTFQNVSKTGAAVVNLVGDPRLMVSQALKEIPDFKEQLKFERSHSVNAPRLSGADAYVELEVKNINRVDISDEIGSSEVAHVMGVVKNIDVRRPVRPFKRVEFFLLESAILATRAVEALKRRRGDVAKNLIKEINSYREKCWRIAPHSREMEMIMKIMNFLKNMAGS